MVGLELVLQHYCKKASIRPRKVGIVYALRLIIEGYKDTIPRLYFSRHYIVPQFSMFVHFTIDQKPVRILGADSFC